MPRTQKDIFAGGKPAMNMSAMIDLVFLLLIFFMVASKMITVTKIEGVTIPIASAAEVPREAKGRVVLNITNRGKVLDVSGKRELTPYDVQQMMRLARDANPKTKLHIRSDQGANHETVKEVMRASSRAGVTEVIFSTYQTD